MSLDNPVLRSHKPSGAIPYPFILVEGEEGAGKSWLLALLSASPKVGRTFWLELGETSAEMYGAVPGARYELLDHDGTYAQVLEQVLAVKALAKEAHAAGEPPIVLGIDTMGNVWDGLKDWVSERAKAKPANQRKLAADPAADLDVSRNLWNDAGNRYRKLTTALLTFPGIVVGIAKGKEISDTDPSTGQPYKDGRKTWRIEGEKNLGYDATVIVRLTRGNPPLITKARSVHAGVRPTDPPVVVKDAPDNLLEWLTFDVLKADPHAAPAELVTFTGGDLLPDERAAEEEAEGKAAAPRIKPQPDAATKAEDERKTVVEWLTNLEAQVYADEFLHQVLDQAKAAGIAELVVDGRTIRGTVNRLVEANRIAANASRPPGENAPAGSQNAAQEPQTPPAGAEEPPETPSAPQNAAPGLTAEDLAIVALEEHDPEILRQAWTDARDNDLLTVVVDEWIGEDDLATMGAPADAKGIVLGGLLQEVNRYVGKWGRAVRSVDPDGGAPQESPASPAPDAWAMRDTIEPGDNPPPGWL